MCATAPGWKRKGKGPGKPLLYFNLLQLLSVASQRLSKLQRGKNECFKKLCATEYSSLGNASLIDLF